MTTSDPLIQKIDCIRLSVPNLEAGLAFYRDHLGHQVIWRTAEAVGLRLPETGSEIVLHTVHLNPEIDLLVQSVDEAAARIKAGGGKVIEPPFDIQIGRAAVVEDPWKNRFVILDVSKGLLVTDRNGNVIGNAPPGKKE
jgi:catechol 2,3-dioxygenase-like lactoylglutathione lyase family enzyme